MREESLEILLKALRLPFMAEQWQELEQQAISEGWSYSQYLCCLCEQEQTGRDNRRLQRNLKNAKLPVGKTLANFDFAACPGLEQRRILQLANQPEWVKRGENLLLFGPSGTGRTHLSTGISLALLEQGLPLRYFSATTLVQQQQQAKANLSLEKQLLRLDRYALLVIDDIGYVKRTESETSVLFELIAHRYERQSLMITSNHPFRDWDRIFADTTMTVAAIDRLVHHATIIEVNAESYL